MKNRMRKLAAGAAAFLTLAAAVPGYTAALTEIPDGVIIADAPAEEVQIQEIPSVQPSAATQDANEAAAESSSASVYSDAEAVWEDPQITFSELTDSDEGVPNVPVYHLGAAARGNPSLILNKAQEYVGWQYSQSRRMEIGWSDCSSFVWRVFRAYGVTFGSASYAPTAAGIGQWLDMNGLTFTFGSVSELEPGDVLFWGGRNNGRYKGIYHTGIYAGNGRVYEAASSSGVALRAIWGVDQMPFAARLMTPEGYVFAKEVRLVELIRQARILTGILQARGMEPSDEIRRIICGSEGETITAGN